MVSSRTLVHAIIGAVVGVVLSFIPFSTVIGGAVAGFLEGPDTRDGALVGALAGAITFVPVAAGAFLVLVFLGFGFGASGGPTGGLVFLLFVVIVATTTLLFYTVGVALLGGYVGSYLAREYPEKRTNTRRTIGMSADERAGRPPAGRRNRRGPPEPTDLEAPDSDRPPATDARNDRTEPTRWQEERETDRDE
ncbi:DUF5518 domain-containing protein [Natrarchaeobius chitinivorans]|uniref:DUF5518 domain-containing protein n=1 Tax=Natrarchaeobius chitinivorans TaxID=1679083 RepID=A0A3N6PCQ1_NATCH|nr:DUF5518 domain-containing protein [Natrarchaeobius chitinivorans]RQG94615.1 hypothetical protein EA473_11050 [Natrarchaeobius chitinivorans]